MAFENKQINALADVMAPDGAEVRILCHLAGGSMAQFTLNPGQVSLPVAHRTVEEIWFVVAGSGRMWRKMGDQEEVVALSPGLSLTIPLGCQFQYRCDGAEAMSALAITMPPWPGADEAFVVEGPWEAAV